jgi:uncharacterized protein (DUF1330 family)
MRLQYGALAILSARHIRLCEHFQASIRQVEDPVRAVTEMEITDRTWIASYLEPVTRMIERRGGRFLARTSTLEKLEGARKVPQVVVLIEWPSKEDATSFFASEEYRPYLEARQAGSFGEGLLIAGQDATGVSRVPE